MAGITHVYGVDALDDIIDTIFGGKEKIAHENLDIEKLRNRVRENQNANLDEGKIRNRAYVKPEREYADSDEQLLETAAKYEELAKGLRQKVEDRHKKPLKAQFDADSVKIYKMGETFLVVPKKYIADYERFLTENGITPIVYAGSLLTDLTLTRE